MAWGRRRAGPGLPANPISVPDIYIPRHLQKSMNSTGSSATNTSTPATIHAKTSENMDVEGSEDEELYQVEVYSSKEESIEVLRRRTALQEPIESGFITRAFSQLQQSKG